MYSTCRPMNVCVWGGGDEGGDKGVRVTWFMWCLWLDN